MNPFVGGLVVGSPLMVAKSAVEEGLKTISAAVPGGPEGGVVWWRPFGMVRRGPSGLRPEAWSTEKQDTPPRAPPLRTHAGRGLVGG